MLKNKEVKLYFAVLLLLFGIAFFFCYQESSRLGFLVLAVFILVLAATWVFQRWRYRQIQRLSDYLDRILRKDFSLDLQDNTEGELSILKNKISKVTIMLSEQAELLQKDKRFLADAMSDISHQLKTPLTSMMVMTELLNDPSLPAERREEFLHKLRSQLERIQWLLSSLLKLSRLDARAVVFHKETVSLKQIIDAALQPLLIPLELKGQQITEAGLENIAVSADLHWTAEAVLNILKNCMEHTPQGGTLCLTAEENPIYTALHIRDNGEGIPKEELPHIFERFYRGRNSAPDSVGIGLAMAKEILQAQGAQLSAVSTVGAGTEFTIKFYRRLV